MYVYTHIMCIYTYTYIYIDGERDMHIYIYIYIYTHIALYIATISKYQLTHVRHKYVFDKTFLPPCKKRFVGENGSGTTKGG